MIGLVAKDIIVFKKICKPAYRLLGIILLLCTCTIRDLSYCCTGFS